MSLFLLLNNLHFGIELFGAFAFFIASWLLFDAYLIKKSKLNLWRTVGFLLVAIWFVFHALGIETNILLGLGLFIYFAGLIAILFSYWLDKLPSRPVFSGIIILPALAGVLVYFNSVAFVILALISVILIKRYFRNVDRMSKWLAIGFILLTLATLISVFVQTESPNLLWIVEHSLRLIAFVVITGWVWQFLRLRAREQTLISFVATAMLISLLVTMTFSTLLLRQIEAGARSSLSTDAKVFNFYLDSLQNQALAQNQLVANNEDLVFSLRTRNVGELEKVATDLMNSLELGFLTVADANGNVLIKAHFPSSQGDNILAEQVGAEALEGRAATTIEMVETEGFSIRAGAPVFDRGRIIGAVISGFLLDNFLVDNLEKITGLETTIFADEEIVASTIVGPDGKTRIQGIKLTDQRVKNKVITRGEEFVGQVKFLGKETLGAFLPLKNLEGRVVGILATTKTQIELVRAANATNRLTVLVVLIIVIGLIVPLYRFSKFLT